MSLLDPYRNSPELKALAASLEPFKHFQEAQRQVQEVINSSVRASMESTRALQQRLAEALNVQTALREFANSQDAIRLALSSAQQHANVTRAIQQAAANAAALSDVLSNPAYSAIGLRSKLDELVGAVDQAATALEQEEQKQSGLLDADNPTVVLPMAVVDVESESDVGKLITVSAIPWLEIVKEVSRNPDFLFGFAKHPRNFEEFIAATYSKAGCDVVLTPSSGDLGRDVIATVRLPGVGSLRIYDQAKAYGPNRPVTANDVRAMYGVISRDQNVSKGVISTSSLFAPGVYSEFAELMPTRLELNDGAKLRNWLLDLAGL